MSLYGEIKGRLCRASQDPETFAQYAQIDMTILIGALSEMAAELAYHTGQQTHLEIYLKTAREEAILRSQKPDYHAQCRKQKKESKLMRMARNY